ncbi:BrnT family toxin [Spirosoma rhododendri]|uniref:BrnT family toxin n=1 Tax=Spirosoma rhododendri TaxID=2728024 RepID=A0A7L5DWK4_9BACT|nr:BrnT family toxin [Spirosoma rhododendri]QJD81018.1 BrnT family toxin [Spirosoma rhododendri]
MILFQWDDGNTKHILRDYPERDNSISEVESVFADPFVMIKEVRSSNDGEARFQAVGLSNRFRVCSVVFVVRNSQIRPISCWPSKAKVRNQYAENTEKRKQEASGRNQK